MVHVQTRRTRLFTVNEVLRMAEAGIFDEGDPVELLHGELVLMSPIGPPHVTVSQKLASRLDRLFEGRVRTAAPIVVGDDSLPEPDVAVTVGDVTQYERRHPRGDELVLAAEVSRTSLSRDREKARLYASAGVPVYWIFDVENRRVEVHSDPAGDIYAMSRLLGEDELIEVPGTDARWRVADLLPSKG